MQELWKILLGLLGFSNEAGDEKAEPKPELLGRVKTGLEQLKATADKAATLTTELANERTAHQTAKDKLAAVQGEKDTAVEEFNNERAARIGDALAAAIDTGRITAAEKATWERRLKADFANELPVLQKLERKVKTEARTAAAGKRTAALESEGVTRITELVNEELTKLPQGTKHAWDIAFKAAARKHPEVFAGKKEEASE